MQNANTEHSSRKVAKRRNKQIDRKKMERNEIHHDCFCIEHIHIPKVIAHRHGDIDFNFHLDMMILYGNLTNLYGFTIDYGVIPLLL